VVFVLDEGAYPDCKPIYLIEGLTALMRKNTNARNRAFQAEVLRSTVSSSTRGVASGFFFFRALRAVACSSGAVVLAEKRLPGLQTHLPN
jgi:hypothetical protein